MELEYQEHIPPAPLGRHVRCIWELTGSEPSTSPQLIVPDGCMELIVNFGDPVEQVLPDGSSLRQPRLLVVGEMLRPVWTRGTGAADLLGVRIAPGSLALLLGTPPGEVINGMADERSIESAPLRATLRSVASASPEDRIPLLEGALCRKLERSTLPPRWVDRSIDAVLHHQGRITIDALAGWTGVSRRTLERHFLEHVGCPPKALAQVIRFRRVLRSIETPGRDWTTIALETGYYDQAHLIRDFRRFTGGTPRRFLEGEHPLIDAFFQDRA